MKNYLLLPICCIFLQCVKAQGYTQNTTQVDAFVQAYDANGKLIGGSTEREGSPMLYDQWMPGEVRFKNGRGLANISLRFNLAHQDLWFQKDDKSYVFSEPVYQFQIVNPDSSISLFRNGYPVTEKNDDYTFYEVLADGKPLQLLLYRYKTAMQIQDYNGPEVVHYTEWGKFYIYNSMNNQLTQVTLQKASLKKRLPELAGLLEQYPSKQVTLKQLAAAVESYNGKQP